MYNLLSAFVAVKWTVRREENHRGLQSSIANQRSRSFNQVTEATENHPLETGEPPHYKLPNNIPEKQHIDYTVIYEDPTSPSYVV